jgi:ATP-dependent DNA helicase RecG
MENLKSGESETVEFKKSISDFNGILATVSAFSNTRGGVVLIGVDDDGEVIGVKIGRRTLEDIVNKIAQNTNPKIYPEVKVIDLKGKHIVEIRVSERTDKPVFACGVAYRRVGRSNVKMDRDEIVNLLRRTYEVSYEDIELASIEDIDLDKVKAFMAKARNTRLSTPPSNEYTTLKSLGLINRGVRIAALLLFGKNPQSNIPWATVKIGKFISGKERPIIEREIYGDLVEQIERSYVEILSLIRREVKINGVLRRDLYEYPLEAIRELIVNAVTHRDYSIKGPIYVKIMEDKIVIENPGGLPSGITVEDLKKPHRSILRNPKIANILYIMGYIEKWGIGTLQVLEKCILNGNGEPIFTSNNVFRAEIKSRYRGNMDENEDKVINYIREKGKATRKDLEKILNLRESTVRKILEKLQSKGLIVKDGRGKKVRYKLTFS